MENIKEKVHGLLKNIDIDKSMESSTVLVDLLKVKINGVIEMLDKKEEWLVKTVEIGRRRELKELEVIDKKVITDAMKAFDSFVVHETMKKIKDISDMYFNSPVGVKLTQIDEEIESREKWTKQLSKE